MARRAIFEKAHPMRKFLLLIAAAFLVSPAAAGERRNGEAELARALDGREAGRPVRCIDLHRVTSSRMIEGTAILYRVGATTYVNRPRSGADQLNRWDAMVVHLSYSRLCSVDTIRLVDATSGFMTGLVFLGDFVPYHRPRGWILGLPPQ